MKEQGRGLKWWGWMLAAGMFASLYEPISGAATQSKDQVPALNITIRVFNFARVSEQILHWAESVTTTVFKGTGIQPLWVDCSTQAEPNPVCREALAPSDFVLRILSRQPSEAQRRESDALGYAVVSPPPERGCVASVYYDAVLRVSFTSHFALGCLLGLATAHELGHLLLGTNSHSGSGLMRGRWNREDLGFMSLALPKFTPVQAELMRADVRGRVAGQESPQTAGLCRGVEAFVDLQMANPTLAIHIYNDAGVSPKTLLEAENIVAIAFRKAGVEIQ